MCQLAAVGLLHHLDATRQIEPPQESDNLFQRLQLMGGHCRFLVPMFVPTSSGHLPPDTSLLSCIVSTHKLPLRCESMNTNSLQVFMLPTLEVAPAIISL